MRRFALVLLVVAACGKHATKEQAQAACEHQIEIGYWEGFSESIKKNGRNPDDPAVHKLGEDAMVDQKKTAAWQAELSKCADTFANASPSMIDCIMAAKNEADLKACLK